MKENKPTLRPVSSSRSGSHTRTLSFLALALWLALGSSLLSGCAVGAAVGAVSAVTSAGLLASTVEHAVRFAHQQVSLIVQNETEVYTGPGEEYSKIGRVNRGVEVQLLAKHGDWIKCTSGLFEKGWIHSSRVANL